VSGILTPVRSGEEKMAFMIFKKSCICACIFCLTVSLPLWSLADAGAPKPKGPATVTSVAQQPVGYSSDGQNRPIKPTDPATKTYTTPVPGKPKPTEPVTTVSTLPGGVSSKFHTFEKKSSININDHVVMVSGSISVGYANGKSRELVYDTDTDHKNSELDWPLDQVAMFSVGASIKPLSWLRFNGNVWFKINDGNGNMDDYDWRAVNYDDWTDWSHSASPVTEGLLYDVNMELTFLRFTQTSFFGIVGYKHDHWKWEGNGGTYIYSTDSIRDTVGSLPNETLISYEQTYDAPYIGIGFHANLDPVTLTGRFIGSTMVRASDEDHHLLRDLVITSSMDDGKMYGIDFACTYNFTQHIAATAAFQYAKFEEIKGDKNWNFFSDNNQFQYGGGLDNESSLFYLSLLFTL